MGFQTKDIADITEPKIVSLASNPNFVIFESKPRLRVFLEANLTVKLTPTQSGISGIIITDSEGGVHSVKGTTELDKVGGNIFFISNDVTETAENLKNALISDKWVKSNFDIKIPFALVSGGVSNGNTLNIKSRGTGTPYNITLDLNTVAYGLDWVNSVSKNNDSITGEEISTEIELDIFEQTGVFLDGLETSRNASLLGTPFTSIQKTYTGDPLWFELNTSLSKRTVYNPPALLGWFNTGTVTDYRFIAKVRGKNSYPFYYSDVLYILNGYGYALDPIDLTPYTFDGKRTVKLLTNKPYSKYIRGQKEFINFIFADKLGAENYTVGVAYKLRTFGGKPLAMVYDHETPKAALQIVNTCVIDLSKVLEEFPNTGKVDIVLTRDRVEISEPLRLEVIPECLHTLNGFVFLNKLGGWDSFNADTETEQTIKQSSSTYNRTLTPNLSRGDSLETVHNVELGITYSLETNILDTDTRIWLQELLASPVIFDQDGNYIILEDSGLKISTSKEPLSLKYRISDTYNG